MASQPSSAEPLRETPRETPEPPETAKEEPEVAAASAAEITYGKSTEQSTDLSDLAAALEPVPHTPSEHAPTTTQEVAPTDDSEPERVLSKEEMVEEALNCPCIAAMRDGPCGDSFISAYRCFLESETEPKGMDCMEQFTGMQSCMAEHPEEYNLDDDEDDPFAAADGRDEGVQGEKRKEEKDVEIADKTVDQGGSKDPTPTPEVTLASST